MKRRRDPHARRSVWYVVAILSFVVVVGFAAGAYEINHLRTQVNGLQHSVNSLGSAVSVLYTEIMALLKR